MSLFEPSGELGWKCVFIMLGKIGTPVWHSAPPPPLPPVSQPVPLAVAVADFVCGIPSQNGTKSPRVIFLCVSDFLYRDGCLTTLFSCLPFLSCYSLKLFSRKVAMFYSLKPDGQFDDFSLHGACPVITGEMDKDTGTYLLTSCLEPHMFHPRSSLVPSPLCQRL